MVVWCEWNIPPRGKLDLSFKTKGANMKMGHNKWGNLVFSPEIKSD